MPSREEDDRKALMFGKKLRTLRKEQHLTQAELAQSLSLTSRTLINYELGKCFPKQLEILSRIATLFDVTVDYLMNDAETEEPTEGTEHSEYAITDPDAERLLEETAELFYSDKMSENDRDMFFRTVGELYWDAKERGKKLREKEATASRQGE